MNIGRNPPAMTPEERLREIAAILCIGYRRWCQKSSKELADRTPVAPPCEPAAERAARNTA